MSDLVDIRLQQARMHLQSGNASKAVELLEQARALSRGDQAVLVPILQDLVRAYNETGHSRQADLCAAELRAVAPPTPAPSLAMPAAASTRRGPALPIALACAVVLLIGCAGVIVWRAASQRYDEAPSAAGAPARPLPAAPSDTVAQPVMPATPPSRPLPPAGRPVSASAATAAPAEQERAALVKEGVGLVIQVARYQGPVKGRIRRIDMPIETGTCFVVARSGLMLTNRHVVSPPEEGVPATLKEMSLPTMALHQTLILVCFGSDPSDHCEASVLYVSRQHDVALLKLSRTFARPFSLKSEPATLGEQVFACGYPGILGSILREANPEQMADRLARQAATDTLRYTAWFDKGMFDPTLTAGIVSAPARELAGTSYIQIDAKIAGGNSGGPLLNRNSEVIGMVTFGGTNLESQGYNFALSLSQIMGEILPYLQTP